MKNKKSLTTNSLFPSLKINIEASELPASIPPPIEESPSLHGSLYAGVLDIYISPEVRTGVAAHLELQDSSTSLEFW